MTTIRNQLREILRTAEGWLDDCMAPDGTGIREKLGPSYLSNSIRTALNQIRAGQTLLEQAESVTKQTKTLTLRYIPATHQVGGPNGERRYPARYNVVSIANSVAYHPGEKVDEAQVALLVESDEWNITVTE